MNLTSFAVLEENLENTVNIEKRRKISENLKRVYFIHYLTKLNLFFNSVIMIYVRIYTGIKLDSLK